MPEDRVSCPQTRYPALFLCNAGSQSTGCFCPGKLSCSCDRKLCYVPLINFCAKCVLLMSWSEPLEIIGLTFKRTALEPQTQNPAKTMLAVKLGLGEKCRSQIVPHVRSRTHILHHWLGPLMVLCPGYCAYVPCFPHPRPATW